MPEGVFIGFPPGLILAAVAALGIVIGIGVIWLNRRKGLNVRVVGHGPENRVPVYLQALKKGDPELRRSSIHALVAAVEGENAKSPRIVEVVQALHAAQKDADPEVRASAADALRRIQKK